MTDKIKKEVPTYTFLSAARAGFLTALTPRAYQVKGQNKGEPKYDGTFILAKDSDDLKAIKDMAIALAKSVHPGKKLVARRLTQEELDDGGYVEIAVPWKDGDKLADKGKKDGKDYEWARGNVVVKASSKYAPSLSSVATGKVVAYTDTDTRKTHENEFYAGAYFAPLVGFNTYKEEGDPSESGYKPGGVALWLNALCFVKHGAKLGGKGVNAAEVFKGYAGKATSENPGSNEMDDEIPF